MVTTSNVGSGWNFALRRYIEAAAIRQFRKSVFFYDMGKKRTLANGDHSYAFNLPVATSLTQAQATLQEGITPTETSFTYAQVDVSMQQYGVYTQLSDVALKDNPFDLYTEAGWELGRRMAEIVDGVIQNSLDGNGSATFGYNTVTGANLSLKGTQGSVVYASTANARSAVSSTMVATASKLAEIQARLRADAVPTIDGGYVALVHPFVVKDMISEAGAGGFFDLSKYSQPENIFNGEIGKLYDIRVVVAPNMKVYTAAGASSANVYPSFIVGDYAYGVVESQSMETIVNPLGSAGSADPLRQRGSVGIKIRFGAAILKGEALIRFESASSLG